MSIRSNQNCIVFLVAPCILDAVHSQRTLLTAERIMVPPCPPSKNCTHPEWGKGFRSNSHFELLPSGRRYRATITRTARHKNSFFLQAIQLMNSYPPPPHYAITMCNNLIFICYHMHPRTSLACISFYSIPFYHLLHNCIYNHSCFHFFPIFQVFLFIYIYICVIFILILFLLSVCRCCLCEPWSLWL